MFKEIIAAIFIILVAVTFVKLTSLKYRGKRVLSIKISLILSLLFPILIVIFFLLGFFFFIFIGIILLIIFFIFIFGRRKIYRI